MWNEAIPSSFSDTSNFYKSRELGQESLQLSEGNCRTHSCPLRGRRSFILSCQLLLTEFKKLFATLNIQNIRCKPSSPCTTAAGWQSLQYWFSYQKLKICHSEHWLSSWLPRQHCVSWGNIHTTTKHGIRSDTFSLRTSDWKSSSGKNSSPSPDRGSIFFLNLYELKLERHSDFMFWKLYGDAYYCNAQKVFSAF